MKTIVTEINILKGNITFIMMTGFHLKTAGKSRWIISKSEPKFHLKEVYYD